MMTMMNLLDITPLTDNNKDDGLVMTFIDVVT